MKLRPKMERDRLQILRLKLSKLSEFKQINKLPYSAEGLNPLPFIDDTLSLRGNPSTFEKKLLDNIVPMKCRINTKKCMRESRFMFGGLQNNNNLAFLGKQLFYILQLVERFNLK